MMTKWKLGLLVFAFLTARVDAKTLYVRTTHANATNQTSYANNSQTNPWKTISMAAANALPNDTIRVEVGDYGLNEVTTPGAPGYADYTDSSGTEHFDHDGVVLSTSYVAILGYNTTLYDLDNGAGVPADNAKFKEIIDQGVFNGILKQPTLYGTSRSTGTGIRVTSPEYGSIHNITVVDFSYGVASDGADNTLFDNVLTCRTGRIDATGATTCWGGGILVSNSDSARVLDCRVRNCAGIGVNISTSDDTFAKDTEVYCDDNQTGEQSATDYYFQVADSDDCEFEKCAVYRLDGSNGWPLAKGHGFVIAGWTDANSAYTTTGNTLTDCYTQDMAESYLFIGERVDGNTVVDCESKRTQTNDPFQASAQFTNGAKNNVVSRTKFTHARTAIIFNVWEGRDGNPDYAAEDNLVENCIFDQCENAVGFHAFTQAAGNSSTREGHPDIAAKDNTIRNCTFVCRSSTPTYGNHVKALVYANRENEGTLFTNCIFSGFPKYEYYYSGGAPAHYPYYTPNLTFDYCCFYDNGTGFPTMSAPNVEVTTDPITATFELNLSTTGGQQCHEDGTLTVPESYDFTGVTARKIGYRVDIGARESTQVGP